MEIMQCIMQREGDRINIRKMGIDEE